MKHETPIDHLIKHLSHLPGLGARSARRAALHLLQKREEKLMPLIASLQQAADTIKICSSCGNLDHTDPCRICMDPKRQHGALCIVAHIADLWAIERTGSFQGRYFVLGGVLSALDGVTIEDLKLHQLKEKIAKEQVSEIIIALSATFEAQATSHVILDLLKDSPIPISRLAHGVPVGGELDYLDDGTISTALKSRTGF
jgi:recombination protein RecR